MRRRRFLQRAAGGAAGFLILRNCRSAHAAEANDRLNVALVGIGGRGQWFVDTIPTMENVVALCDVDDRKFGETYRRWSDLRTRFTDSPHPWERDAAEWFAACRGGRPAVSNFDYSGPLNEFLQLGNLATQVEGAIEYDPLNGTILNNAEAERLLRLGTEYRTPWTL